MTISVSAGSYPRSTDTPRGMLGYEKPSGNQDKWLKEAENVYEEWHTARSDG
jgi:hypothetical protein